MKILILTGIFPPDIGGPVRFLEKLSEELVQKDFSVSVLTYGEKDKDRPYPVYRISKKLPYALRGFFFLILAFWLSLRHDIIYNQDLYGSGRASYLIKKILGKKVVTRFVGDSAWETAFSQGLVKENLLDFQDKKYSKAIEKMKAKRNKILLASDKVVVVSNFLKEAALKMGVLEKNIEVIYNSVDFLETDELPPREILKKKFGLEGRIMLTSARLVPWKGVKMLVEIMPGLVEKYGDLKLVIIGEGVEKPLLEDLVLKLDLGEKVKFLGRVDKDKMAGYLKASDLFVLNTFYEGMSHTLLEAMKVATPVITTFAGGNPEVVRNQETGILVHYNDKGEWTKAIAALFDNQEKRRELVQNARNDLKRFNWQRLVSQTIEVFRGL